MEVFNNHHLKIWIPVIGHLLGTFSPWYWEGWFPPVPSCTKLQSNLRKRPQSSNIDFSEPLWFQICGRDVSSSLLVRLPLTLAVSLLKPWSSWIPTNDVPPLHALLGRSLRLCLILMHLTGQGSSKEEKDTLPTWNQQKFEAWKNSFPSK